MFSHCPELDTLENGRKNGVSYISGWLGKIYAFICCQPPVRHQVATLAAMEIVPCHHSAARALPTTQWQQRARKPGQSREPGKAGLGRWPLAEP